MGDVLTGVEPLHFFYRSAFFNIPNSDRIPATAVSRYFSHTLQKQSAREKPLLGIAKKESGTGHKIQKQLQFLQAKVTELHPGTVTQEPQVPRLPQQTRVLLQYRRICHRRQIRL